MAPLLGESERVADGEAKLEPDAVTEAKREAEGNGELEDAVEPDLVAASLGVGVPEGDWLAEGDWLTEGVMEGERDTVTLAVPLGEGEPLLIEDPDAVPLSDGLPVAQPVPLCEGLELALGQAEPVALGQLLTVGVGLGWGVWVGEGDPLTVAVSERLPVALPVAVTVLEAV